MLRHTEKTRPEVTVGGQTEPVAMAAKRLAHWGNDSDLARTLLEGPTPGRFGGVRGLHRDQITPGLDSFQNLPPGNDEFFEPGPGGVQRHKLNETEREIVSKRKFGQVFDFVVVDTPDDD